jgi:hypothetical protein
VDALAPYARLLELARGERALIEGGRLEELPALQAERAALIAALPARPPQAARELIEEAKRLVDGSTAGLAAAIERTRLELAHLRRGRSAVASYGGQTAPRALDLRG